MNNNYKQAIIGIKINPLRTFLTMIGIMIGIATVIFVLSAGEGFKSYINSQIDAYGSNTIFAEVSLPRSTQARANSSSSSVANSTAFSAVPITTLKNRDVIDIKKLSNVLNAYGAAIGQKIVTYKNVSRNSFIFGADASIFDIDQGVIGNGRGYTTEENSSLAQVAVLGNTVAKDLFDNLNPVGKLIRIGNYNFKIIGVYKKRGGFDNQDEQVFIPLRTLQKKVLGTNYLIYIVVKLKNNKQADLTALNMTDILRQNHHINDPALDDFKVTTQAESLNIFKIIMEAVTFLLMSIAGISLVVGGVGVMNIMYVIVTERIGEIGLKKALGARNKDILYEFLIEAIFLTILGGILGIVVGFSLSFVISKVAQSFGITWKFIVPIWSIILSISISMIIGIIFGVFPARNASRLDPIEALNKE